MSDKGWWPCEYCNTICNSLFTLCQHVGGQKHRAILARVAPEQLKQFGRLQYFLNKNLKDKPILGLEYVVERKVRDDFYLYTCTLCKVEHNWQQMVGHVMQTSHMETYVIRHHPDIMRRKFGNLPSGDVRMLEKAASIIHANFGRKEICSSGPSPEEGGRNDGALPPTSEESAKDTPQQEKRADPSEWIMDKDKPEFFTHGCILCGVCCASLIELCQHIQTNKHKFKLALSAPEEVTQVCNLDYFLHKYMKDDPVLGLEYIVQLKEGQLFKFYCQLCGVKCSLCKMVSHVMEPDHIEFYIRKHHSNMLSSLPKGQNEMAYLKNLRDISVKIVERHGRKEIRLKNDTTQSSLKGDDKTKKNKEHDTFPTKHDSANSSHSKMKLTYQETGSEKSHESYSYRKLAKKSDIDGPPLAKRGKLFSEGDEDASPSKPHTSKYKGSHDERQLQNTDMELDYAAVPDLDFTAVQELEFRTNKQFLEYLAKFSIDNDEDAIFIQKITKNCIKALTNFQEEEAKMQNSVSRPEAPLVHTSKMGQEATDISKMKTASDISAKKTASDISAKKTASDISAKKTALDISAKKKALDISANKKASDISANKTASDISANKTASDISSNKTASDSSATKRAPVISVKRTSPDSSREGTSPDSFAKQTESHSSGSETSLLKDTSNPSSDPISKNETTDYFFSSIKNLDESQVIGIFHKIAATHPEFQGIDIPAVMRFLKDSGRLNAS